MENHQKEMNKLAADFYQKDDVVSIGKHLIGKYLFTSFEQEITGGLIVETESYNGAEDRACHAYANRRTKRTEVMFAAGGVAYVYLCYGMHSLLNVVTGKQGNPCAVLIRAIQPQYGIEKMLHRRKLPSIRLNLTNGPGSLANALGVDKNSSGSSLTCGPIWIEDRGYKVDASQIIASPRVRVDYAAEDAKRPWRFRLANSKWTSRAK